MAVILTYRYDDKSLGSQLVAYSSDRVQPIAMFRDSLSIVECSLILVVNIAYSLNILNLGSSCRE